jgi:glycosyltransferase involved in cell wall biosynthesis
MATDKKVLIVSGVPSHPSTAGSRERIIQLGNVLRELGWRQVLLFQDFEDGDVGAMRDWWGEDFYYLPYRRRDPRFALKRFARRLPALTSWIARWRSTRAKEHVPAAMRVDDWYDPALGPVVASLLEDPAYQAVITEYVFFSRCLTILPRRVRAIVDTVELFAIGRRPGLATPWANLSVEEETRGLRRADVVWAIQKEDEAALRHQLGDRPQALTVGHMVPLRPLSPEAALSAQKILMVAANHRFNLQGIRWFNAEVYPHLSASVRPEQLVLVGSAGEALRGEVPFHCTGRVPDLKEHYLNSRVVICPILDGTGLKIKVVEALGMGRPLVTTGAGATGLEKGAGTAYLRADSPAEFAGTVLRLLRDDGLCRQLMADSIRFMERGNQAVRDAVAISLNEDLCLPR